MRLVDRKKSLFENIARLRRAERQLPPNRDLVTVRAALEQELGETVSRRMAASLLGVSHTALVRWIDAGDLPTVFDASARQGVSVAALLDLREAVDAERRSDRRSRHLLEPAMLKGRDRAERLDASGLVPAAPDVEGHSRAERRSLAYHRALAPRLRRPMIDDALRQIWKWREQGAIDSRYADRWEEILRRPVPDVRRAISDDSQSARDLRQSSPFAGMLSEAERRKIIGQVR